MTLTPEKINDIAMDEEARWKRIYAAINDEIVRTRRNEAQDSEQARALTAEIVNSRNDEVKVSLASDEAVAHSLSKLRRNMRQDYERLSEQPYFARVITKEDDRDVEFLLGTMSFPKQRIVDWRKAPISQLYYNYEQDEEFAEIIQKRERTGTIQLRRGYKGSGDTLLAIELPEGVIQKNDQGWVFVARDDITSKSGGHDGHLPSILSLITSEQFDLITNDATLPVIIQGIAGSGKTTVALHRLAWLVHEDNAGLNPKKCLVIVYSNALKRYVQNTLPELGIQGVTIATFDEWAQNLAASLCPGLTIDDSINKREMAMFKSSRVCMDLIHTYVQSRANRGSNSYVQDYMHFLAFVSESEVNALHWRMISEQLKQQSELGIVSSLDLPVLFNLIFAREGYYPIRSAIMNTHHCCDHIVIDEVQDMSPIEVRSLLNALDQDKTVTVVGDGAQKVHMTKSFGGWKQFLDDAGLCGFQPIELTVSHRSTQQVIDVASHVLYGRKTTQDGWIAKRNGPTCRFIACSGYEVQPDIIQKWLIECTDEHPHSHSAIICRHPKQAKRLAEIMWHKRIGGIRLGTEDNFEFSPGITITDSRQVKGLEFDNVLILNPTENQYAYGDQAAQNLLYIVATRALYRLDILCFGRSTRLLPRLGRIDL